MLFYPRFFHLKATLANKDTLSQTHCCQHKCFPACPRAQHLLQTQILCPGHKNVSDFVQKHFVSTTNVSQFAQPKKHHEQQCVGNNVSSFASTLTICKRGGDGHCLDLAIKPGLQNVTSNILTLAAILRLVVFFMVV